MEHVVVVVVVWVFSCFIFYFFLFIRCGTTATTLKDVAIRLFF